MRPDKPGEYWWFLTKDRWHRIAYISDDKYENLYVTTLEHDFSSDELDEFESSEVFGRWLGPAHPPKRVKVHTADFVVCETWSHKLGGSTWVEPKRVVILDDVKDFLVGGENETE